MNAQDARASYALFASAIGTCGIAWRDSRVVATCLPEATTAATVAVLEKRASPCHAAPPAVIQQAIDDVCNLLEGGNTDLLHIECDLDQVEPLARQVYTLTRLIPPGQTASYGDIALQLGDKQQAQNVGRLLGQNPLPIIVPCHRVIGADGKLTGFSAHGGVGTKYKMLEIEKAEVASQANLFDEL